MAEDEYKTMNSHEEDSTDNISVTGKVNVTTNATSTEANEEAAEVKRQIAETIEKAAETFKEQVGEGVKEAAEKIEQPPEEPPEEAPEPKKKEKKKQKVEAPAEPQYIELAGEVLTINKDWHLNIPTSIGYSDVTLENNAKIVVEHDQVAIISTFIRCADPDNWLVNENNHPVKLERNKIVKLGE